MVAVLLVGEVEVVLLGCVVDDVFFEDGVDVETDLVDLLGEVNIDDADFETDVVGLLCETVLLEETVDEVLREVDVGLLCNDDLLGETVDEVRCDVEVALGVELVLDRDVAMEDKDEALDVIFEDDVKVLVLKTDFDLLFEVVNDMVVDGQSLLVVGPGKLAGYEHTGTACSIVARIWLN